MPSEKQGRIPARLRHVPPELFRNSFSRMPPTAFPIQTPASAVSDNQRGRPLQEAALASSVKAIHPYKHIDSQSSVSSFPDGMHQPLHSTYALTNATTASENAPHIDGHDLKFDHRSLAGFQRAYNPAVQTETLSMDLIQASEFQQGITTHYQEMEEDKYFEEASTLPADFEANTLDGEYSTSGITVPYPNYTNLDHIYAYPVQAQQWDSPYFYPVSDSLNTLVEESSANTNPQYLCGGLGYNYPGNYSWPNENTDNA